MLRPMRTRRFQIAHITPTVRAVLHLQMHHIFIELVRRALVARVGDISEYFLTADACFYFPPREEEKRGRERNILGQRARVSLSIASVIIIQRQKRRQRERKSLPTKEYYISFDASFLRSNIGTLLTRLGQFTQKKRKKTRKKREESSRTRDHHVLVSVVVVNISIVVPFVLSYRP